MTAKGKGVRPPGPVTEELPSLVVHPEFRSFHRCRGMPEAVNVWQVVPRGWELRLGGHRVGIAICPFCGIELEAQP